MLKKCRCTQVMMKKNQQKKKTAISEEDGLVLTNIDKQARHENDDENQKKQNREISNQFQLKFSSFTRIFRRSDGLLLKKWRKVKAGNDMLNGIKQAGIKASYARNRNLKIGEKRVMIFGEKPKDEEEGDEET